MTIALPTFPQTAISRQQQPSGGDAQLGADDTQAGAFADLLASLLSPRAETGSGPDALSSRPSEMMQEQFRHAAPLTPLPGSPAEAFSAARLLVDMALDLPGEGVTGLAQVDVPSRVETSSRSSAPTMSSRDNLMEELALASTASELQRTQPSRRQPAPPANLSRPSGSLTAPELSSANSGPALSPGTSAAPARGPSTPPLELLQSRGIERSFHTPLVAAPSGQNSPFGAQLVRTEAGLQLILRLPKLAESERAGLETALTHLLESHGHRSTAIVIHEIVKG